MAEAFLDGAMWQHVSQGGMWPIYYSEWLMEKTRFSRWYCSTSNDWIPAHKLTSPSVSLNQTSTKKVLIYLTKYPIIQKEFKTIIMLIFCAKSSHVHSAATHLCSRTSNSLTKQTTSVSTVAFRSCPAGEGRHRVNSYFLKRLRNWVRSVAFTEHLTGFRSKFTEMKFWYNIYCI